LERYIGALVEEYVYRWRCSLWKLVWKELLAYVVVFIIISVIYR
jgi:hypothetical protein